jgi:hypothetical protein
MDVYFAGVGMTSLGKHLDQPMKQLTDQAIKLALALADAGASREMIEAAWFSNARQGALEGRHGIRAQIAFKATGFEGIPVSTPIMLARAPAQLCLWHLPRSRRASMRSLLWLERRR